MKLISEHLGEIIVALAGVALLVAAVILFKTDIADFFESIVDSITGIGEDILNNLDNVTVTDAYTAG